LRRTIGEDHDLQEKNRGLSPVAAEVITICDDLASLNSDSHRVVALPDITRYCNFPVSCNL
jgi:hypothetical protein